MNKKISNKVLLLVLLALVVIYAGTRLLEKHSRPGNDQREELVFVDSSSIRSITIYPENNEANRIDFQLDNGQWAVSWKGKECPANQQAVQRMIDELMKIKPGRLVSRSSEKWDKYNITDSTGTRVVVMEEGDKKTLDLMIGRFSYQQPAGGYNQFGQQGISGFTFVRLSDEEEVYTTDGFLAMTFNQQFDAWRNGQIIEIDKNLVQKVNFVYPADSGFVLTRASHGWNINGDIPADSIEVNKYLNVLRSRQSRSFADEFSPGGAASFKLEITGHGMKNVVINCWYKPGEDKYFIQSSLNPEAFFESDKDGLFRQLFIKKEKFLE